MTHPSGTLTGAEWRAELCRPRGPRIVFVPGSPYLAYNPIGTIEVDMTLTAEVQVDREFSDADAWA